MTLISSGLRGLALCGLLGAAVLTSAPQGATAGDLKIQSYSGAIIMQSLYVAQEKGFFEEQDVNVSFVPLESGPAGMTAVISGDIDLTLTHGDLLFNAISKGVDLTTVCGEAGPYWVPAVSNEIDTEGLKYPEVMKTLVGKKIGVLAHGSSNEFVWRTLFEEAGLAPDSATYVAVGGLATALPAFNTGRVDAFMTDALFAQAVTASGKGHILLDLKAEAPESIRNLGTWHIAVGKAENVEAKADTMRGYAAAIQKAAAWQEDPANFDELVTIMDKYAPLPDVLDIDDPDEFYRTLIKSNIQPTTQVLVGKPGLEAWQAFATKAQGLSFDDPAAAVDGALWAEGCVKG